MFSRFYAIFLFMRLFFVKGNLSIHDIILGYTALRQHQHNPLFTSTNRSRQTAVLVTTHLRLKLIIKLLFSVCFRMQYCQQITKEIVEEWESGRIFSTRNFVINFFTDDWNDALFSISEKWRSSNKLLQIVLKDKTVPVTHT